MNLFGLLQFDGIQLKRVARTRGGEYAGPCPFCGGDDRFRVWPEHKGGRYWCRQCGKKGDAVQLLRDKDGLSYKDACLQLGVLPKLRTHPTTNRKSEKKVSQTEVQKDKQADKWLYQAGLYLEAFQECLWGEQGKDVLDTLHGKALSDKSIKSAGLGWNSINRFRSREEWGLPDEIKPDGKAKKLWIPKGLVIPCYADGQIIRLRVRCADPGEYSKYILVPGSVVQPMAWGMDKNTLLIVESELDGVLVNQEAGDLVGVIALGSAQAKPEETTHEALTKANIILNALDSDEAGARAAWSFWSQTYGVKVKRWPCIKGKDPSEAWANGLNIRAWVIAGLTEEVSINNSVNSIEITETTISEHDTIIDKGDIIDFPSEWLQKYSEEKLERLAIMTVDGGLSDSDALSATGL